MAKVRLANTDPGAFPRLRKKFLIADTQHGPVAFTWPKPRGPATQGYDLYRQKEFGLAATWASSPEQLAYQTAVYITQGKEIVPRDVLMAASYGLLFDIQLEDGQEFTPFRRVNPNAQQILDTITEEPGSILLRTPTGWFGLTIGNDGDVLTVSNGLPKWKPQGITPPDEIWTSIWNASLGIVSTGWYNYTMRQLIPASLLTQAFTGIRFYLASLQVSVDAMYVGERSVAAGSYGFASTPTQITVGGATNWTWAGSQVTDNIDFASDGTKDLIVSVHFSSTIWDDTYRAAISPFQNWYKAGGNDAANLSPSGYTNFGTQLVMLQQAEILVPV